VICTPEACPLLNPIRPNPFLNPLLSVLNFLQIPALTNQHAPKSAEALALMGMVSITNTGSLIEQAIAATRVDRMQDKLTKHRLDRLVSTIRTTRLVYHILALRTILRIRQTRMEPIVKGITMVIMGRHLMVTMVTMGSHLIDIIIKGINAMDKRTIGTEVRDTEHQTQ